MCIRDSDGTQSWDYASRSVGAVGNSIKVVAIDSGASQRLTLGGSFVGTVNAGDQVTNGAGTKTAYVHYVSGTTLDIIWISGGVWTTTDVVDDGSNPDLTIVAAQDWYDAQTITGTLNWNQVAPKPGTSAYVAARGGSNDEMHIVVVDTTCLLYTSPSPRDS